MSESVPNEFPGRYASTEELDTALFPRPEHTLPNFPSPSYLSNEEEPSLYTTDELVATLTAENRALFADLQAEATSKSEEDMPEPCLTIIAGSMFGETKDNILSAAYECYKTGETPAWFGDGMSYIKGSLLPNAAASGVAVRLFVPHEVATHPATRMAIGRAGLDPDKVLVTGHTLGGGMLFELGSLVQSRHTLEHEQNKWRESDSVYADDFVNQIEEQLQQVDAATDARLAEEDKKLHSLTLLENARDDTNAVIVIMPPYTEAGDELIRGAMIDPNKDIDGLGTGKRWDQITANAAIRTRDYLALKFAGRLAPRKKSVLVGLGKLVGRRVQELDNPGKVIDGRENIRRWGENPGRQRVAAVITAHRGAESIKADHIRAARWGNGLLGFMAQRLLIIVDVGSVTVTNSSGQRTTVGNLDPRSLPKGNTVIATGVRHGVGPVTGAMAMQRTIQATTEQFRQKQATPRTETLFFNTEDLVTAA